MYGAPGGNGGFTDDQASADASCCFVRPCFVKKNANEAGFSDRGIKPP